MGIQCVKQGLDTAEYIQDTQQVKCNMPSVFQTTLRLCPMQASLVTDAVSKIP